MTEIKETFLNDKCRKWYNVKSLFPVEPCYDLREFARGLHFWEFPILNSMLVNKDYQTCHLNGWQHSHQPIRNHVRKSLLTNMEFNMDFTLQPRPPKCCVASSQVQWSPNPGPMLVNLFPWTKWSLFRRRHFIAHFLEWRSSNSD